MYYYYNSPFAESFQNIIIKLFELRGFETKNPKVDNGVDVVATSGLTKHYIQLKFYRSRNIPSSVLRLAANKLAYYMNERKDGSGLIIINTLISNQLKYEILQEHGIHVWDRNEVFIELTELSIDLRDEFEKLLISAQQGVDTRDVFSGINKDIRHEDISPSNVQFKVKHTDKPIDQGKKMCNDLKDIKCGGEEWPKYESKCFDILKFLFGEHLTLWEKQARTDDELSRFDLICRVASKDDYWRALISSFNTRFILFEFKNYCDVIDQGQIYTTERYLFNKGLRSVGFIIARKGGSEKAIIAAKGALKENGKLILILSDEDLCIMLKMKDDGESPSDYLSGKLDEWLISLSR